MPTLEQHADTLAIAIAKGWEAEHAGINIEIEFTTFGPAFLHKQHGGPPAEVAGRIGKRFRRALNDRLKEHGLKCLSYSKIGFKVGGLSGEKKVTPKTSALKIFGCNFQGEWIGATGIVVAHNRRDGKTFLLEKLKTDFPQLYPENKRDRKQIDLVELPFVLGAVIILDDGDY